MKGFLASCSFSLVDRDSSFLGLPPDSCSSPLFRSLLYSCVETEVSWFIFEVVSVSVVDFPASNGSSLLSLPVTPSLEGTSDSKECPWTSSSSLASFLISACWDSSAGGVYLESCRLLFILDLLVSFD